MFNTLDSGFFFVVDIIIDLMAFFRKQAISIGSIVLLIAIVTAALNYALTGTGLKENIVKIMKATVFFLIVIFAYPKIIGFITSWTFDMANKSIYGPVNDYYVDNKDVIARFFESREKVFEAYDFNLTTDTYSGRGWTKVTIPGDPDKYFDDLVSNKRHRNDPNGMPYSVVPPAAVSRIVYVIASNCIKYSDKAGRDFGKTLKGLVCAFFIIVTGAFALLEYIITFLEFILVASVGVILFPLSIWEGSKFLSEKFIGAIIGFFIKLLFCNISIFLLIYGFMTLAYKYADIPFQGKADQMIEIIFICLLFFFICKSAPGLAQSLLSGTPSLNAAGAISAVGGAVAAAGATMAIAKKTGGAGKAAAGGMAKAGLAAGGMISQATAAAGAVRDLGGSKSDQRGAFMSSIGGSAKEAMSAGGLGLIRSLTGGGTGGGGGGANPHSWQERFNKHVDKDTGEHQTLKQHLQERKSEGANQGLEYLANKNKDQNPQQSSDAGSA